MNKVVPALLIILSVTFITHSSVLNNGFVDEWDDYKYVQTPEARAGLTLENIKRIFSLEMVKKHFYFHPITKLSFALEHQFFQDDPKGYHFDNLLLHLINTALVFWLVNLVNPVLVVAFLTGLLFGIHPLQVETVAWISTRKELLFTAFYLSALISYAYYCLRQKNRGRFIFLSFLFFVCSILSKPAAATLPLAMLILDFHFKRGFSRRVLLEKFPFVALSLLTAVSYFVTSRSWQSTIYTSEYFSDWEKIVIGLSTAAMYFNKLILPSGLSFVYMAPQKIGGVLPMKYFLLAGFPLLAFALLGKLARTQRVYWTGALLFFATIFLSGSGKTFMGDHYVYLPSLGFFLLLAAFLNGIHQRFATYPAKIGVVLVLVIYLTFLSTASYQRGQVWADSMTLFNDALQKYPGQPVALLNRGIIYAKGGQYPEAIDDFTRAIDSGYLEIASAEAPVIALRGAAYASNGQYDEAVNDYDRVIETGDAKLASRAFLERGLITASRGDLQQAIADFDGAIGLDPGNAAAESSKTRYLLAANTNDRPVAASDPSQPFYFDPLSAKIMPQGSDQAAVSEEGKAEREALDKKYWSTELLAQEHEMIFIKLWDDMRIGTEKFKYLENFPFTTFTIPTKRNERQLELDVVSADYAGEPKTYTKEEFVAALQDLQKKGYRIDMLEFHHDEFKYPSPEEASSVMSFVFDVINENSGRKFFIKGQIQIGWDTQKDGNGYFMPKTIEVIKMVSNEREVRDSAFLSLFQVQPETKVSGNSPIVMYDLNHDGFSEMILPALNMIVRNRGDGKFDEEDLFEAPLSDLAAAFVGELTGDDEPDLVITQIFGSPLLYKGKNGAFEQTAVPIIDLKAPKDYPGSINAITAGDIDGDGDLDLFFGQYKTPYLKGVALPQPYFDANDGEPAYLLQNDGKGNFTDITEQAGLGPKRFRRTYSASFVDLDKDRDMDLVVVSDFSGTDMYTNDGKGKFTDVTDKALDKRSSFGMSHTFADFNLDGNMDLYVVGMSSTTARRLTKMGVSVDEYKKMQEMVMPMAYGNRLYYGTGEPGIFKSAPNNDMVARTGWGWGTTTFDLDNDGDPEIFVGNGNQSNTTALDYCTFYWRNDIYMNKGPADMGPLRDLYGRGGSWNGFEHDVLYLNDHGETFTNIGYLMDVAFEFDTRSVISDDVNLDGRMDLIVKDSNSNFYTLLNTVKTDNHWIGVALEEKGYRSPLGAIVTVGTLDGKKEWQVLSGESFLSQNPYKKVFGLGKNAKIDYLEVQWLDGKSKRLEKPKVDQYYRILPPK